jgi:cellulose synthase operon protein YhjQ
MTEPNQKSEQAAPPDDVATLYSWANLHGAKYRDFSAARAQTREKARLRAEEAAAEEQRQKQIETEAAQAAEAQVVESEAVEATSAESESAESQTAVAEVAPPVEQNQQIEQAAHEAEPEAQLAAQHEAEEAAAARQAREAEEQAAVERFAAEQAAAEKAAQEKAELEKAEQEKAEQERAEQARAEQAKAEQAQAEAESAARQEAEQAAARAEQEAAELAAQRALEQEQAQQREEALQQEQEQERERELGRVQAEERDQARAQEEAQEQAARVTETEQAAQRAAQVSAERAAEQAAEQLARQRAWQQPLVDRFVASQFSAQPTTSPFAVAAQFVPAREDKAREEVSMPRSPWPAPEIKEPVGRPAWLSTEAPEAASLSVPATPAPPLSKTPEDTLQGSRDRMTSRWFALRGVFDGSAAPVEAPPAPTPSHAPSLAVFSLAGGVGKTSLVATLGRALSARGERVLLVDTAAFGLLPFFFGATDQRPGVLRTFTPPGLSNDAPVQLVTIDADVLGSEAPGQESLSGEIQNFASGASRILVDLATASGATTRRIMRMAPMVLVPVIPDMNSVVSVSSIDAFFEHNSSPQGRPVLPYYVLNQFDPSLPLHLDVREVLREQLGERLLPFALRRAPSMSEALAEGMTVLDYAPGSSLAEDFSTLAGWLKSISAPATTSYRGIRWSER